MKSLLNLKYKKEFFCRILLPAFFVLITIINAGAATVDHSTARKAALNFLQVKCGITGVVEFTDILELKENGDTEIYLFFFKNGFVAVTGDDNYSPVIAYSNEGMMPANNIPPAFQAWLQAYSRTISEMKKQNIVSTINQSKWNSLLSGQYSPKGTKQVLPLCTTRWDQGCYYNELCPYDTLGPCDHAVTGCVATAMAQVMKFWNYPATGTGSHTYTSYWYGPLTADFGSTTYDWLSMPDSVGVSSPAVATLMYHCGVAVEMDYAATSSGSWLQTDPLCDYFSYSHNMHIEWDDWYSPAEWIALLKSEIDSGRPMIYAGQPHDTLPFPGHAWVVDGYDDSDFFHFNWGWGSSGAYCEMENFFFAYHNEAICGMMPVANCDITVKQLNWPVHKTFTAPEPVKVTVSNYFNTTLNDIPLAYQVDGGTIFRDTLFGPLAPNTDTVFTFSQNFDFSPSPGHFYEIKTFSELPCDAYKANDTLISLIENIACTPPPYSNGFEPAESQNGWFIENVNNDYYTWYNYSVGGHSGPHALGCQVPSDTSADDWLISRCIYLEAGKVYKLSFWYNAATLYVSNDLAVFIGNEPLSTSMSTELISLHDISTYIFEQAEVYFTVPTDGSRYFGWHCYSAEGNYGVSIDDIMITEQTAPDAGVTALESPVSTCDLGMENIDIIIRNFSSQPLTDIPVSYTINGGSAINEIIPGTIAPGEFHSYTFSLQADLSASGDYTIKVFTSSPGDTLNLNDTLTVTVHNTLSPALPYSMGFEPADDYSDWKVINVNGDGYTWNYFSTGGASQPWCARYDYSSMIAANDWIVSKCILLESSKTYRLSFKTKIEYYQWPENLAVYYCTTQDTTASAGLIIDMPGLLNMSYVQSQPQFSVPADGYYYIGWHCYSDPVMFNLYLDDIYLEDYTNGTSPEDLFAGANVFPQPFCDQLNVILPENTNGTVNISLETIQGRSLLKTKVNGSEVKINTADLGDGIYILKVSDEKGSSSFKVVKYSK